jgi:hypothetical protein
MKLSTLKFKNMFTNIFHHNSEYIGINIERNETEFVVCVAFKKNGKWKAKTLSGIFGDLCEEKLFEKVISDGIDLGEKEASNIFSNVISLNLEYSSK